MGEHTKAFMHVGMIVTIVSWTPDLALQNAIYSAKMTLNDTGGLRECKPEDIIQEL